MTYFIHTRAVPIENHVSIIGDSNLLIEEFMLLANRLVAKHVRVDISCSYRMCLVNHLCLTNCGVICVFHTHSRLADRVPPVHHRRLEFPHRGVHVARQPTRRQARACWCFPVYVVCVLLKCSCPTNMWDRVCICRACVVFVVLKHSRLRFLCRGKSPYSPTVVYEFRDVQPSVACIQPPHHTFYLVRLF